MRQLFMEREKKCLLFEKNFINAIEILFLN